MVSAPAQARLAEVVAAAGAITALIAGTALFDEFGPGALLAAAGGLAVLVAAALTARRLRRTVRYRIGRPHSAAVLAGKIAALLAGLAGAVAAPSLPRTVIVLVVVGALAAVVNTHAVRWTLFQVDATGLKLGRAAVPWPAVARIDLAGAAPDAVEIGVQLAPGQVVSGSPVPGTVLADLPVCTIVPAIAVHVDRIRWAVGEFGNPAVPVVVREQADMPPHAPGPGPGGVVGGALALVAVLVAGVVTAVVLAGGDEPGQPRASEPERGPRYSAAGVEEPCDLIDVYVLKRWSTVPEIITEPGRDEHPDYDWLRCGAHSDSEYLVGRVTHLDMVIGVAEDARAARDFHAEQEAGGLWVVSGDVREQGTVDDLGESAEFEQAISTYGDHTRTDYVLRLRDDNLSLFLKFGSDADQSDGAGVTVSTLADAARTQARSAMEKLRTRPSQKRKTREPANVPKAVREAVTLPSTADLMARIRAADPCELHNREVAGTFGRVEVEPHQALGLAECRLMAVGADGTRVGLGIRLGEYLTEEERADLVRAEIDGREVFHSEPAPAANACAYRVPFGTTGFGAEVSVSRYVPGAAEQAPWPEACEVAGEYTAHVAPALAELPARSAPAPEPTLVGKDPCVADEVAATLLPDWQLGPVGRYQSAQCRFTMTQGDESYEFDVSFDRDAEQLGDEPANVGGLTGVWFNQYEGQCGLSLVFVPETTPDAWDAQNIGVSVQYTGGYGSASTLDLCELVRNTATLLIERAS